MYHKLLCVAIVAALIFSNVEADKGKKKPIGIKNSAKNKKHDNEERNDLDRTKPKDSNRGEDPRDGKERHTGKNKPFEMTLEENTIQGIVIPSRETTKKGKYLISPDNKKRNDLDTITPKNDKWEAEKRNNLDIIIPKNDKWEDEKRNNLDIIIPKNNNFDDEERNDFDRIKPQKNNFDDEERNDFDKIKPKNNNFDDEERNDFDRIRPKDNNRGEDPRDGKERPRNNKFGPNDEQNDEEYEPPLNTNRALDFEPMKPEMVKERGLKCVPGRTVVQMGQHISVKKDDDDNDDDDFRRTHMNWQEDKSKEQCKICTCSLEGKDESCSGRPARNLNECLVLARLSEELNSNMPFSHERELSNRIRRFGDLLWHNDEIPYEPKAKCRRGFSFYSNNFRANDTDIDVPQDVNSLLNYPDTDICFHCVCSTDARSVHCLPRDPWFCEHFRTIRQRGAMREYYAKLFQQDRPSYFRSLSFRLRRTMDWGLNDMIDIAQKRIKRPECIPFISEYNDCSEYTTCKGCNQCRCSSDGHWVCLKTRNTCSEEDIEVYDDGTEDNVVGNIMQELAQKQREERPKKRPSHQAPLPEKRERVTSSPVLDFAAEDAMRELHKIIRGTRSLKEINETGSPIKFHHVLDEMNEDTLKNSNISGTLGVRKVDPVIKTSRRTGVFINSTSDPLHIEYNHPTIYNNHITDNKIDTSHNADQYDALLNDKTRNIMNYTQTAKDKELSKLVVNELKRGSETIGDPNAPVASNITFTPEKDALTAMAYIAGNLLNKLWNLERDATDDSIETDKMKNQKIDDLLELFKEPLTFRQETFLKDALEYLSDAVRKNKDNKHFSLCKTVEEMKKELVGGDKTEEPKKETMQRELSAKNALSKLTDILGLINKYEDAQNTLNSVKQQKDTSAVSPPEAPKSQITKDNSSSLNLFGNILEKITNLLMPNNNRMKHRINNQNILRNSHNLEDDVKKAFNINLNGMKLTSADKLILDYISRLKSSPCPSSNQHEDKSIQYKQSDILLNLSEFFKIKSYSDLMKLVDPATKTSTQSPPTTPKYQESRRTANNESNTETISTENNNTISVNDKLKLHLKAIVNDLIELQNAKGKDTKSEDINITDALPCIFKILNQEKDQFKDNKYTTQSALLNKIKNVLEAVKRDIRDIPQNRRNMNNGKRPKSAVVWERLVKSLDQTPKPNRRFFKIDKPQSYDVVKKMIDHIESNHSNTYKLVALQKDIPAADKLVFLKTLLMDTSDYANVLAKLLVLNSDKKLPEQELNDLLEFVDTARGSLDLNAKVIKDIDSTKQKTFSVLNYNNNKPLPAKTYKLQNHKLTSEQALNLLIKDRVKQYMKKKEAERTTQDMGYGIAQRILSNLEIGSDKLAQELYKILIETRQRENSESASKPNMKSSTPVEKRPVKFDDPSQKQWLSEDLLLKTLESAWANAQTV